MQLLSAAPTSAEARARDELCQLFVPQIMSRKLRDPRYKLTGRTYPREKYTGWEESHTMESHVTQNLGLA